MKIIIIYMKTLLIFHNFLSLPFSTRLRFAVKLFIILLIEPQKAFPTRLAVYTHSWIHRSIVDLRAMNLCNYKNFFLLLKCLTIFFLNNCLSFLLNNYLFFFFSYLYLKLLNRTVNLSIMAVIEEILFIIRYIIVRQILHKAKAICLLYRYQDKWFEVLMQARRTLNKQFLNIVVSDKRQQLDYE